MFTIGYVLAIVVALIPALSSYASTGRFSAIPPRRAILLAVIVLGIICFEAALRISLEYYWFSELGKTQRFLLALGYRAAIFFVVAGRLVCRIESMCRPVLPFCACEPVACRAGVRVRAGDRDLNSDQPWPPRAASRRFVEDGQYLLDCLPSSRIERTGDCKIPELGPRGGDRR
jgi:hypothetical protein